MRLRVVWRTLSAIGGGWSARGLAASARHDPALGRAAVHGLLDGRRALDVAGFHAAAVRAGAAPDVRDVRGAGVVRDADAGADHGNGVPDATAVQSEPDSGRGR